MEPIVSPWFMYLLGIVEGLLIVFGFLGIAGTAAYIICKVCEIGQRHSYGKEDEDYLFLKAICKRLCWFIPVLVLFIFIPSKKTLIGMYVADHVTSDNVEKALIVGKDFKEEIKKDILELIDAIQNDEKKTDE